MPQLPGRPPRVRARSEARRPHVAADARGGGTLFPPSPRPPRSPRLRAGPARPSGPPSERRAAAPRRRKRRRRRGQRRRRPASAPAAEPACPFELLGLQRGAAGLDEASVRSAYKRRALLCHPDKGGSHDAFHALSRARDEVLAALGLGPGGGAGAAPGSPPRAAPTPEEAATDAAGDAAEAARAARAAHAEGRRLEAEMRRLAQAAAARAAAAARGGCDGGARADRIRARAGALLFEEVLIANRPGVRPRQCMAAARAAALRRAAAEEDAVDAAAADAARPRGAAALDTSAHPLCAAVRERAPTLLGQLLAAAVLKRRGCGEPHWPGLLDDVSGCGCGYTVLHACAHFGDRAAAARVAAAAHAAGLLAELSLARACSRGGGCGRTAAQLARARAAACPASTEAAALAGDLEALQASAEGEAGAAPVDGDTWLLLALAVAAAAAALALLRGAARWAWRLLFW